MDWIIALAIAVVALQWVSLAYAVTHRDRPFWRGYLEGWALPLTWLLGRKRTP